ncbi:hypothetical protein O181_063217 [Austropuccinia psidii MF-1]|uniref:Uncharacterized protein n=1 Tax=Austropuccinia psidii MF-1 TaxID=1389203 RepID=A0A9Q3ETM1_9BASI|nr:hypothetical protein [Austropuccinia psidii MF-1]
MPHKQTLQQSTPGPSEPSKHNEQPIPGLSQPSEPHEYTLTCKPEPEVALMQSTEEPFACPTSPTSVIIIDDTPIGSPSPHSHDEAQQEFMYLQPTFMIPQAIVHKSINQILLEHHQFLHMIPFVDVTHQNEMHQKLREELNSLLGTGGLSKGGHHRNSLKIPCKTNCALFSLFTFCNTLL